MKRRSTFIKACQDIINLCPDQYAKAYANAGIHHCPTDAHVESQILYILNNVGNWRGERARQTKQVLRSIHKELETTRKAERKAAEAKPGLRKVKTHLNH